MLSTCCRGNDRQHTVSIEKNLNQHVLGRLSDRPKTPCNQRDVAMHIAAYSHDHSYYLASISILYLHNIL